MNKTGTPQQLVGSQPTPHPSLLILAPPLSRRKCASPCMACFCRSSALVAYTGQPGNEKDEEAAGHESQHNRCPELSHHLHKSWSTGKQTMMVGQANPPI